MTHSIEYKGKSGISALSSAVTVRSAVFRLNQPIENKGKSEITALIALTALKNSACALVFVNRNNKLRVARVHARVYTSGVRVRALGARPLTFIKTERIPNMDIHPADELADVRKQIAALKQREAERRESFIHGNATPIGDRHSVTIKKIAFMRVDVEAVKKHFGLALDPFTAPVVSWVVKTKERK